LTFLDGLRYLSRPHLAILGDLMLVRPLTLLVDEV